MSRRRGYALILVLATAAVIGAVLVSISSATTPLRREAFRRVDADAARALARSGVALARVRLKDDPGYAGVQDVPLGRGRLSVRARRAGQGWQIDSSGAVDGVHARTRVTLRADGAVIAWEDR